MSDTDLRVERPPQDGPSGLSGWLILVCIGLILTFVKSIRYLNQNLPTTSGDESWAAIMTSRFLVFHPELKPLLITEIVINLLLAAASVGLLGLFFSKSWLFPKVYVIFLVASLLVVAAEALAFKIVLPERPLLDGQTISEFARSALTALVWIPYMRVSKRVKNTFVK